MDEEFAKKTQFKHRIAHGMITEFIPKKKFTIVVYDTTVTNQDNVVVTSGQAQCMATK